MIGCALNADGAIWTPASVDMPAPDPDAEGGSAMQHVTFGPRGLAAIDGVGDGVGRIGHGRSRIPIRADERAR